MNFVCVCAVIGWAINAYYSDIVRPVLKIHYLTTCIFCVCKVSRVGWAINRVNETAKNTNVRCLQLKPVPMVSDTDKYLIL